MRRFHVLKCKNTSQCLHTVSVVKKNIFIFGQLLFGSSFFQYVRVVLFFVHLCLFASFTPHSAYWLCIWPSWCFLSGCMHLTGLSCHYAWQVDCHSVTTNDSQASTEHCTLPQRAHPTSQSHPFLPVSLASNSHSKSPTKAPKTYFDFSHWVCSLAFSSILVATWPPLTCCCMCIVINWNFCFTTRDFFLSSAFKSSVISLSKTMFLENHLALTLSRSKGRTWSHNREISHLSSCLFFFFHLSYSQQNSLISRENSFVLQHKHTHTQTKRERFVSGVM